MDTQTVWEGRKRTEKVVQLVIAAQNAGHGAWDVAEGEDVRRRLVAETGVREPSEETWRQVVASLHRIENTRAADPFDGLTG